MWNRNLHLYRNNHSTNTALSQLVDSIFEDSEDKKISNVMAVDESAAFNCLQVPILLDKLRQYKFHEDTIQWIESYLTFWSQFVSIGGQKSRIRAVSQGVPQGSILGPIFFNLYINELPDTVNDYDECIDEAHKTREELFNKDCRTCGNLPCYADDAIYTVGNKSRNWNQERILIILERITVFLNANGMAVNKTKTMLMEAMMKQKECKMRGTPPKIVCVDQGNIKEIGGAPECLILGTMLQRNLQWQSHIETSKDAIIPVLRKRVGMLKYLLARFCTLYRYTEALIKNISICYK